MELAKRAHSFRKLMFVSVIFLVSCSGSDQSNGSPDQCEGSTASCTFHEILSGMLERQPASPRETDTFTIDFIKQRYGIEEIDCSHPLLSDNSEFGRIAGLSPGPDMALWFSHEELEKYDHLETAWECDNGERFTEYEKGSQRSTSESLIIDQGAVYGIIEGTVTDPEALRQLEVLWENCKVGTEPPNFTGVYRTSEGFLPQEDTKFCVTLDILPGAMQCFARTVPPKFVEYSIRKEEISREPVPVSEADYCYPEGNSDVPAGRIKIF